MDNSHAFAVVSPDRQFGNTWKTTHEFWRIRALLLNHGPPWLRDV
jgi:hypothetical protein